MSYCSGRGATAWVRLLLLIGVLVHMPHAGAGERERQREQFRDAWRALARGDWNQAREIAGGMGNYLLLPYLRAEQMRQRSSAFDDGEIVAFLDRYRTWAFRDNLRRNWLRTLGRDGHFERLLQHATDEDAGDAEIACYRVRARINRQGRSAEETADLTLTVQQLWRVGESQHQACDPAFEWLQGQKAIPPSLAWERFGLVMARNNRGLARYLRRFLDPDDRPWADRWLKMAASPANMLRQAASWSDGPRSREITVDGLRRLARGNPQQAWREWERLRRHFRWSSAEQTRAVRAIALQRALELEADAVAMIDRLPQTRTDPQLLAWRARVLLARRDWSGMRASIERMPASSRQDPRWRYWLAQALLAGDERQEAVEMLQALAGEALYYGFLAADWLRQPYRICAEPVPDDDWRSLPTADQLERAIELHHVGLTSYANIAWRQAVAPLDEHQRAVAAALAAEHEWWLQSVLTLTDEPSRRLYDLRFPAPWQPLVRQHAGRHALEQAFVYGLMRAESAMNPGAVSPANARGLMQVTPATARTLARANGMTYRGSASLLEPHTNLVYGSTFLAAMLERYDGDPVLALGAYNAGPRVVERWQRQRGPYRPDIWIETVPYFETREYIPRVLAFSVIYDWRLNGEVIPITARMPGMERFLAGLNIPAGERRAVQCTLEDHQGLPAGAGTAGGPADRTDAHE